MKKALSFLLILSLASIALTGCGGGSPSAPQAASSAAPPAASSAAPPAASSAPAAPAVDTNIVIVLKDEPMTMDPHDCSDMNAFSIQRCMLDGLFGFDDDLTAEPVLAESMEASDDATEYTIKLRQGISFTDGTPFNADAALVNLERLADQSLGLQKNSLYAGVSKLEKLDDYTVKITLKEPFGAFLNTLANPASAMISPAALEKYGKEVSQHPVGTGRFVFQEWNPGDKLVITKNPNYWGDAPAFDSITFKAVTENSTRVAMLQAGDADFIMYVPTEQVATLQGDSSLTVDIVNSTRVEYIGLNVAQKPFDDVRVRQAVNYAVDKEAAVKIVYNGLANIYDSPINSTLPFHVSQTPYGYDPDKAKALLAEAGYPDGFTVRLDSQNSTLDAKMVEFVQQQLAVVGITVEVNVMERGIFLGESQSVEKGTPGTAVNWKMRATGWSTSTLDVDWLFRPLLTQANFPPQNNVSYYSTPRLEELVKIGMTSADRTVRGEAYKEAQEIVWKDAPWLFMCSPQNVCAYNGRISGVKMLGDATLSVKNGKIEG